MKIEWKKAERGSKDEQWGVVPDNYSPLIIVLEKRANTVALLRRVSTVREKGDVMML